MMRVAFAALHLLALGIGLGAVWARARGLRGPSPLDAASLRRVFYTDSLWGVSAIVWIATGLARVFASMEKSTAYYMQNSLFWTKMTLLALILVLEIRPMLTFIRWRAQLAKGETPDTTSAGSLATTSTVQALIVITMVFVAAAMARGFGA